VGDKVTYNGTSVAVVGQALWFDPMDQNNRPVADHPFSALIGDIELRFGLDWERTNDEAFYRVHVQLGNEAAMANPPPAADVFSNLGVGPSLLWAGPNVGMAEHEALGYEVAGTATQATTVSGKASVRAVVSVPDGTFHECSTCTGSSDADGISGDQF